MENGNQSCFLYSLELFNNEVDDLQELDVVNDPDRVPDQPPLLNQKLHQRLLNYLISSNTDSLNSPAQLVDSFKMMRPKNFIKDIDDEVEKYSGEICQIQDSGEYNFFDSSSKFPHDLKSYTQRLQEFCTKSPLLSLQDSARWYFKRCFPNQYRGKKKPRDIQIAHLPLPIVADSDLHLEVAVSNASKGSVDSIFLVSSKSTLFQLRDYIKCINASESFPLTRHFYDENGSQDPLEFFYINGFFYTVPFPPNKESIEYIYAAMRLVEPDIETDELMRHILPMADTDVASLNIQCDALSGCYTHMGTMCNHFLTFRDCIADMNRSLELNVNKKLPKAPAQEPIHIYKRRRKPLHCDACRSLPATTLRYFDANMPFHPTLLCYFCHTRVQEDYLHEDTVIAIERPPGEYSGW